MAACCPAKYERASARHAARQGTLTDDMEGRAASGALTTRGAVARKQRARHECGCPVCLPPRSQVPAFTHALFTHAARAAHMRAAAKRSLSLRLPSSCGLAREGEANRCHERRRRSVRIEGGKPGLPHLGVTCGRSRRASRRGQRAPRTPPRAAPAMSVSWPVSTSRKVTKKKIFLLKHNFRERIERRIDPRQDSEGGRERPACHAAGGFSRCFPCRIVLPVG